MDGKKIQKVKKKIKKKISDKLGQKTKSTKTSKISLGQSNIHPTRTTECYF